MSNQDDPEFRAIEATLLDEARRLAEDARQLGLAAKARLEARRAGVAKAVRRAPRPAEPRQSSPVA